MIRVLQGLSSEHIVLASEKAHSLVSENELRQALKEHYRSERTGNVSKTMFSGAGPDVLLVTTWAQHDVTHLRLCWEDEFDPTSYVPTAA